MKKVLFAIVTAALALPAASFAITVDGVVDAGYGPAVSSDAVMPTAGEGGAGPNAAVDLADLFAVIDSDILYVAMTVNVNVTTTDWGKFCLFVNSPNITGTSTGDQWGRAVTSTGSNYQFHSWVDGGGGSSFNAWDQGTTSWVGGGAGTLFAFAGGATPSVIEIGIPLANLGNPTTSVDIVAWVTGGGGTDNGQDAIPAANGNATDWGTTTNLTSFVNILVPSSVSDWTVID